jgi:putative acetyltransferase
VLTVRKESPRQDDVGSLLRQSDAFAAMLYPREYRRPLSPEALAAPGIHVFVARTGDLVAAGCCAVFDADDGTAELKRMIVDERFRNRGVGMALLQAVDAAAVAKGMHLIRMEVGIRNTAGQRLYRRAGYTDCGPFGSYKHSPISLFLEKALHQLDVADAQSNVPRAARPGQN